MAGKRKQSNAIWYTFAVIVAISVIGLISDSRLTGMQIANTAGPQTPLNNAVEFLRAFGFFNVVLPFLLVFAIVFGILEKSRIFGVEKIDKTDYPRRNLNAIVAFSVAFFVVAAANIVSVIQASIPMIALVLMVLISFLLLFGTLLGQGEINLWEKSKPLKNVFVVAIFVAMVLIFLGSFGVLDDVWNYIVVNLGGTFITSFVLVIIIIAAMWFIAHQPKKGAEK